jgi:hypothetical protein
VGNGDRPCPIAEEVEGGTMNGSCRANGRLLAVDAGIHIVSRAR